MYSDLTCFTYGSWIQQIKIMWFGSLDFHGCVKLWATENVSKKRLRYCYLYQIVIKDRTKHRLGEKPFHDLKLISPPTYLCTYITIVLGTSTARSKICSARSKICPLEERSCSKCSKKISLGFRSARYVLEKSCTRARSARIFYARYARNALGMEHKKSIILFELFVVCSEYFFKIVPGHSCSRWPFCQPFHRTF